MVKKLCANVQRELELFNEIYHDNQAPMWDKEGLFVRRQKKTHLKIKAENKPKATITARTNSGIEITSLEKRPLIRESLLRELILQPSCAPLRVYSGIESHN